MPSILAITYSFGVLAITSITQNTRKGYDRQLVLKTPVQVTMSLLLLLACLCAAARGASTASGWDTCDWVQSNSNGGLDTDEHWVGDVSYPWQCIATKGFKPGTNAQRHRFYRHGSSDVSSRLADLTSMVRDSFRRVNVVSETDSGKASPAAAQPAARPQLSWRASAPEYGTFES